ncbi:response regulator [Herbaspirillum sp. YR522]|uniref:response regulator n=1 Tax=Herbaspirillum sp. YR522 TaxID=1144342 RepID=UPI00026F53FE|nr:response regulator [Herbaspirillum sp. YR522]EJM98632.1 response regulator with CheY-like receiver domain and winged-helix DNA-binding domain [Herbaspirillum sp. YR522]
MAVDSGVNIILVEDDDGHALLVEKNLRRAGLVNDFRRLRDGQEALDFFFNGGDRGQMHEVVVLLDVNMPRVTGIEVLRQMKQDASTAAIPVIMLTTTDDPREIERCYEYGCNVYITKPVEYDDFIEAVRRLGFFLQVVKLPATPAARQG